MSLGLGGVEHVPLCASQEPASWQASRATQTTGLLPVQVTAWHMSVCVQALLSLHAVPFAAGGATQVPVPASQAAIAEPQAGKRLSPLVCTGVLWPVSVLSPSWPKALSPQAQTVPSDFSATVWL